MELTVAVRTCKYPNCSRRLSRYNKGPNCFFHTNIPTEDIAEKRLEEIERALGERRVPKFIPQLQLSDVALSILVGIVSYVCGVAPKDVLGFSHNLQVIRARRVVIFFLHEELHRLFPQIARDFNRKEDGAAIEAYTKIKGEIHDDEEIQRIGEAFRSFLHIVAIKV